MSKTLLIKANTIFKPHFGKERYVSGIGRSTYHLLKALAEQSNLPFDIKIYGSGVNSIHTRALDLPFDYSVIPFPQSLGTKWTKLEPYFVSKYNNQLLHIHHNYDPVLNDKMRFIVTIHDTCEYDKLKVGGIDDYRADLWRFSAKRSLGIITCSSCSKADIIDRFGVPEEKIKMIPWGVDTGLFYKRDVKEVFPVLSRYMIKNPYFLAVSCSNERKNIDNLLKAFRLYLQGRSDISLVLLWNNPPKRLLCEYADEIAQKRIMFLDYVSDEDLAALYSHALGTMFPSRYEGFGFPILESFACGTPVMTCRNSSLGEVGGSLAEYVGEDNIDEMVQVMELFSSNSFGRDAFAIEAVKYAQTYSWAKTAQEYIKAYQYYLSYSE
jgi:glycosyltransferase involved in cell wall biosynthesis